MMPFEAQSPVTVPKLSEMSKLPLLLVIAVSCACASGLDTPLTVISD